jgi:hypothetical protein
MTTATFIAAQVNLNVVANTATVIGAYVVPAATTAIVTGGVITNKSVSTATLSVSIWNGSTDIAFIASGISMPAGSSFSFAGADAKWTLGVGQGIRFTCNQIADAVMGVMQVA